MSAPFPPSATPPPGVGPRARTVRHDVRFVPLLAGPTGRSAARRTASVVVLVAMDVTAVFLGIFTALALKLAVRGDAIDTGDIWTVEQKALPIAAVTAVLLFAKNGLYASREGRGSTARILSSVTVATLIVAAILLATGWEFETYYIFYASWFFVVAYVLLLRASYDSITGALLEWMRFERRVLLVGQPDFVAEVAESLEHADRKRARVPYRVVGRHTLVDGVSHDDVGGDAADLRAALDPAHVDEVILTGGSIGDRPALEVLDVCRRRGLPVRLAPTTVELLSHSLRAIPVPGLPLFELRPPVLSGVAFMAKRAFDIVVGALLLVLVSPLLAAAAIAITLEDRGPVLYRSRRVGLRETTFDCLKLRTMRTTADQEQAALEAANEAQGALFKIRRDPRVTRVGDILRRYSIDELPQLVNVIRGEMSLVGPRPLPERDYALLDDVHRQRYLVLPGMTGMWQVSGRSELSFDELVRL
ncbi:MAG: exopolysaccharide biosynthesis polyprenyl glycosylphosphotransferase, partial [Actinomycetota bacterium]